MKYSWQNNDYNTGTQLNPSNFESLYPLIFFDLSYQAEQVTRDPKQLIIQYQINTNDGDQFRVHAIVVYEKDIVIDKMGDQLVIV